MSVNGALRGGAILESIRVLSFSTLPKIAQWRVWRKYTRSQGLISSLPLPTRRFPDRTSQCSVRQVKVLREPHQTHCIPRSQLFKTNHTMSTFHQEPYTERTTTFPQHKQPIDNDSCSLTVDTRDERSLSSKSSAKSSVRFSQVKVRTFPITLGESAAVTLPISLDWDHSSSESFDIDTFESQRQKSQSHKACVPTSVQERMEWLRLLGYTAEDIDRTLLDSRLRVEAEKSIKSADAMDEYLMMANASCKGSRLANRTQKKSTDKTSSSSAASTKKKKSRKLPFFSRR